MATTKPSLSPEETRTISRLRALGQGVRVFCLDQDKRYAFVELGFMLDSYSYTILPHCPPSQSSSSSDTTTVNSK